MKIPDTTIKRLSLYYRILQPLSVQGAREISSKSIAELLSLNPAQIRKDLSYFGTFGKPKTGYNVSTLVNKLAEILGISEERKVVILGAGNLGSALAAYRGFNVFGFKILGIFDIDQHKVGKKIKGIPCYHINEFNNFVNKEKIEMAVIAVPTEFAQETSTLAVKSGIKAILNFAPVRLNVPDKIKVNNVDLALELKSLSYFLAQPLRARIR